MTPPNPVIGSAAQAEPPTVTRTKDAFGQFHLFSFLLGLLIALVLIGGTLLLTRRPDPPPITLHPPPTPPPTATPQPPATPAPITVFVSGAVHAPGLYALPATARVGDALADAGGLSANADAVAINQAELLWDGAQVHVPAKIDESVGLEGSSGGMRNTVIEPPAGVSGAQAVPAAQSGGASGALINVNSASPAELETLPGIGPSKAAAIIVNRPFDSVDDLERVPGIGAKTIEQLRELIIAQ